MITLCKNNTTMGSEPFSMELNSELDLEVF